MAPRLQASEFNNLEAVNTLFGLASLGFTGGPDPGSWLGPLLSGGKGGSDGSAPAAGSGARTSVASMRVADLTRTTWALTQFDWRPPEWWLEGATRAFVAQLRWGLGRHSGRDEGGPGLRAARVRASWKFLPPKTTSHGLNV